LDEQPWPSNHPCSRKVVLKPNLVSQWKFVIYEFYLN
jgi:hypothetical protein